MWLNRIWRIYFGNTKYKVKCMLIYTWSFWLENFMIIEDTNTSTNQCCALFTHSVAKPRPNSYRLIYFILFKSSVSLCFMHLLLMHMAQWPALSLFSEREILFRQKLQLFTPGEGAPITCRWEKQLIKDTQHKIWMSHTQWLTQVTRNSFRSNRISCLCVLCPMVGHHTIYVLLQCYSVAL